MITTASVIDYIRNAPIAYLASKLRELPDAALVGRILSLDDDAVVTVVVGSAAPPDEAPRRTGLKARLEAIGERREAEAASATRVRQPGAPRAAKVGAADVERVFSVIDDDASPIAPGLIGARTSLAMTTVSAAPRVLVRAKRVTLTGRGKGAKYVVAVPFEGAEAAE